MKKPYFIGIGVNLGVAVPAELYFGTVFNESVRHPFDLLALVYAAPALVLNHILRLGLPFDGPNHSVVLWLSVLMYAAITCLVVLAVRSFERRDGNQQPSAGDSETRAEGAASGTPEK